MANTYSDPTYGFSLVYPEGFVFERLSGGAPGSGYLMGYRAVDLRFVHMFPPGQIELAVYARDNPDLTAWITGHSGLPTDGQDVSRYFETVSNRTLTARGAGQIIFFDWTKREPPMRIRHAAAFQFGQSYVMVIQSWADATYDPNLAAPLKQLLDSVKW